MKMLLGVLSGLKSLLIVIETDENASPYVLI
jgi:hypothetical protein